MAFIHRHAEMQPHSHDTVTQARECEIDFADYCWDARAERATEQKYERWLEDAGSRLDPAGYEHDRMMEAQQDWGRRRESVMRAFYLIERGGEYRLTGFITATRKENHRRQGWSVVALWRTQPTETAVAEEIILDRLEETPDHGQPRF